MKISKRGEYALRALIDIGIATHHGQSLVRIGELAEHEKLPVKFLEQILTQLKGGGFVSSKRGKQGGYYLRKPTDQITFGAVIRLIDGPLAPISCVSVTAYERCSCPDEAHCGLRMLMLEVRNAIAGILDRYSLADVVALSLGTLDRDQKVHPMLQQFAAQRPAAESLKDAASGRKSRPGLGGSRASLKPKVSKEEASSRSKRLRQSNKPSNHRAQ